MESIGTRRLLSFLDWASCRAGLCDRRQQTAWFF